MFGDDDVARNIHNEQQRDAMPHPDEVPTEEEILEDGHCWRCGEEDTDLLTLVEVERGSRSRLHVACEG